MVAPSDHQCAHSCCACFATTLSCLHEQDTNGHRCTGPHERDTWQASPERRSNQVSSRKRWLASAGIRPEGRYEPSRAFQYRAGKAECPPCDDSPDSSRLARTSCRNHSRLRRGSRSAVSSGCQLGARRPAPVRVGGWDSRLLEPYSAKGDENVCRPGDTFDEYAFDPRGSGRGLQGRSEDGDQVGEGRQTHFDQDVGRSPALPRGRDRGEAFRTRRARGAQALAGAGEKPHSCLVRSKSDGSDLA